jgi:hypothetical protein
VLARRIGFWLALLVLSSTGVLGLYNGVTEWGNWETRLQMSVSVGVILYGVLGIVAATGLVRRTRWSAGAALAWGIVVTYVGGVAAVAYAGADASVMGGASAALASGLIAWGVVWTARSRISSGS